MFVFSHLDNFYDILASFHVAKHDRLARKIKIALPRELTKEQGISLIREYVKEQFVNAPHPAGRRMRAKQKKEYILNPQGKKIYDPKKRQYKCKAIPATARCFHAFFA